MLPACLLDDWLKQWTAGSRLAAFSGEAAESCGFKMAGAEGGPGDGELWQTWLPNHAVFLRLQEGRENQGSAETEKPASSLPSSPPLPPQSLTRNLLSGLAESSFCGTQKTPS